MDELVRSASCFTLTALVSFALPALAADPGAMAGAAVIQAQDSNWSDVPAELTEFKRKGKTLTAKVRFTNNGQESATPEVHFSKTYLLDANGGKKYEVLRDQDGAYIGSVTGSYTDRWYMTLEPGKSATLWMKFPAPPIELKEITLQLPSVLPFEDVPIQDQ